MPHADMQYEKCACIDIPGTNCDLMIFSATIHAIAGWDLIKGSSIY